MTSLWESLGSSATYGANVAPFTYVLPKIWMADGATATTAVYASLSTSTPGSAPVFGTATNTGFSNEWAVYNGNVANLVSAVPVPGAVWLFGSALAGFGVFGRRKQAV